MKRVVQIVVLSLLSAAAVLLVMGLILPHRYHVQRSILINAAPDSIHPWVEDFRHWPSWATWNRSDPTLEYDYAGPPFGKGATQRWRSTQSGSGSLTITYSDVRRGVWFTEQLADGITGKGSLSYAETHGVTAVTWQDEGELPRVIGGFLRGHFEEVLGKHLEEGLARLKREVEESQAGTPAVQGTSP